MNIQNILEWLQGRKTYIVVILAAIYNLGLAQGWWTMETPWITTINIILGTLGFGFLRAGITKSGLTPIEKAKLDKE